MSQKDTGHQVGKKQLVASLSVVGLLLALLLVATLDSSDFTRAYVVGPYGLMSAFWAILIIGVVAAIAGRGESDS